MQPVFLNIGPFWDIHPDVYPDVTRYTDTDEKGNILECWERNNEGIMVDVTEREKARIELEKAQQEYEKFTEEDEFDDLYDEELR
jgi:hypothetical protein